MATSHSEVQTSACYRSRDFTVAPNRTTCRAISALLLVAAIFSSVALAQTKKGSATADHLELIVRATEHELHALESPTPFQFQERLEWSWGTETRSVIETPEGRADRIVLSVTSHSRLTCRANRSIGWKNSCLIGTP